MKALLKNLIIRILTLEARLVLKKYKPKIVAVTGNVGKTSTKDALYTVLSHAYYVRKSEKSFNSDIGVPLTILGGRNGWNNPFIWLADIFEGLVLILAKNHYPKWLILEVGADRPGDIASIAKWLHPDIVVVTRIGDIPVHVEFFSSPKELIKEKEYLVRAVKKDGLVVIENDGTHTRAMREKIEGRVLTYGTTDEAGIWASNERIVYNDTGIPVGINFKVNYGSTSVPVFVKDTAAMHYRYPVLAACAVAVAEDINLVSAVSWIGEYITPPGRVKILPGEKGSTIIDDTYNASPEATQSALDMLANIECAGRKIAILGDMMELGKYSDEAHDKIGESAAHDSDIFIAVGARMARAGEKALASGMDKEKVFMFADAREAGKKLSGFLNKGDVVVVKGSQSMRMERLVEKLMAHPEQAINLLVRQDVEWLSRP